MRGSLLVAPSELSLRGGFFLFSSLNTAAVVQRLRAWLRSAADNARDRWAEQEQERSMAGLVGLCFGGGLPRGVVGACGRGGQVWVDSMR